MDSRVQVIYFKILKSKFLASASRLRRQNLKSFFHSNPRTLESSNPSVGVV